MSIKNIKIDVAYASRLFLRRAERTWSRFELVETNPDPKLVGGEVAKKIVQLIGGFQE